MEIKRQSEPDEEVSMASIASSLLGRLKTNDDRSWQELVHLYRPTIQQWLRRAGVNDADAADLEQEVLHSVWQKIADFKREGSGATFRGWLWTITHNKIRDLHRRQRRIPEAEGGTHAWIRITETPDAPEETSTAPPASKEEGRDLIRRAIELVKNDVQVNTWQAFWLVTVEGLSAQEAAERLGIGVGSVYTAKSRVLSRLREVLGDDAPRLVARY
jgi:RNA polymerase sigma-70 factor, ECF subfamily